MIALVTINFSWAKTRFHSSPPPREVEGGGCRGDQSLGRNEDHFGNLASKIRVREHRLNILGPFRRLGMLRGGGKRGLF